MNPEQTAAMLRSALAESLLMQRLFFASLELAALALVVGLLIWLRRIRSPRLACLLWLVVLIKPIVSLAFGSPIAIGLLDSAETQAGETADALHSVVYVPPHAPRLGWAESPGDPFADRARSELPSTPASPSVAPAATSDPSLTEALLEGPLPRGITVAWVLGVMLFLGCHLWARVRLYGIVRSAKAPSARVMSRYRGIASELGLKRIPRLLVTEVLDSPALAGLLRPAILLPSWMAADVADPKLDWSFRHELMHWKWLDPLLILVRDVAAILFHFHPVAWWAGKRQTEAMELACDRALLVNDSDASNYAEQLYQILKNIRHRRRVPVAGGLFATRTQVGKRIAALLDGSLVSTPRLTVFSVLGLLLLAVGALAVGGAVRSRTDADPSDQPGAGERVLRFPAGARLGMISVRQPQPLTMDWRTGWETVGPARGTVRVPADKDVWLHIDTEGVANLGRVRAPAPGDIQVVTFYRTPPDAAMAWLARCGKLKWVAFFEGLPGGGLDHLAQLKSLEALMALDSEVTDQQLGVLVGRLKRLKSLRWLELGSTQLTDAGLAHLRELRGLEKLCFNSHKMSGPGLAHLADLPRLQDLRFGSASMDDKALEALSGFTSLKHLTPNCPKITDAGLPHLATLKALEGLDLRWLPITDAGLPHLSGLESLRDLDLQDTKVTDAGLAHLAGLKSLERLALPEGTTDAGLVHLRGLKNLKYLWLGRTKYTGVGLQALQDMKLLESLTAPGGITDEDLAVLGGLTSLTYLDIHSGAVTDAGLAHLGSLKALNWLCLGTRGITGSGLVHLQGLPIKTLFWTVGQLDQSRLRHLAGLQELELLSISADSSGGTPLQNGDLASVATLRRLKGLNVGCKTLSDGALAELTPLASLEDLRITFALTDKGLGHLAKLKGLRSAQIHGDFTDAGLQQLAGMPALRMLLLWSDSELNPAALERLKKRLPAMEDLRVLKLGKVEPRPGVGQAAPAFTVQTVDGKQLRLEDYRGKVVLLHFWSTWCKPCVASTPALKAEYAELSRNENFRMISLSLDDDEGRWRWHLDAQKLNWPQARLGTDSEVAADYGVSGVPAFFVIGPDGKVVYTGGEWEKIKAAALRAMRR
jgi:beta-lactamase regulating signal transducer with metallopeptidase domain/peroxiredoxin/Leucine-rich repeat (LRR) protein